MRWMAVSVAALILALPAASERAISASTRPEADPPTADAPVIVLRAFKLPKKNKCRPVAGVIAAFSGAHSSAVTGSACTSHDGADVTFAIFASTGPTMGGGFIHPGVELRYGARLQPDGTDSGTGLMTAFHAMATREFVAYECHNAYPDNV